MNFRDCALDRGWSPHLFAIVRKRVLTVQSKGSPRRTQLTIAHLTTTAVDCKRTSPTFPGATQASVSEEELARRTVSCRLSVVSCQLSVVSCQYPKIDLLGSKMTIDVRRIFRWDIKADGCGSACQPARSRLDNDDEDDFSHSQDESPRGGQQPPATVTKQSTRPKKPPCPPCETPPSPFLGDSLNLSHKSTAKPTANPSLTTKTKLPTVIGGHFESNKRI
jgi:hypothetical protein